MDRLSFANTHEIQIKHIDLKLNVSFYSKTLSGEATFQCRAVKLNEEGRVPQTMTLDTQALKIHGVDINGQSANFHLNPSVGALGSALVISIPSTSLFFTFVVKVKYSTTPSSSGIFWLDAAQTADKVYPYMFTQAQAIRARSILPCQDSPCAKFTYKATIQVPSWATCLMSAFQIHDDGKNDGGEVTDDIVFKYHQKVPIPSYLVALVVGSLEKREIGPRTRIWSEASVVDQVAHEFDQTEEFIQHAEEIMDQKFVWGKHNLVCLPPSFPCRGKSFLSVQTLFFCTYSINLFTPTNMIQLYYSSILGVASPCLTFVTPTFLTAWGKTLEDGEVEFQAGRELASVIAHEIAHSWTGNLITGCTWEHFWLNEGWTVWLQRKIMLHVDSMEYVGASNSIDECSQDHDSTRSKPCPDCVDLDDSFSNVPYERGFNFLNYLSRVIGEGPFETFAQAYLQRFKYKTVNTEQFCAYFCQYCGARSLNISRVDFDAWINQLGMVTATPDFDDSLSSSCMDLAQSWCNINHINIARASALRHVSHTEYKWEAKRDISKISGSLVDALGLEDNNRSDDGDSVAALEKIQNLPDASTWTSAQVVLMLEKLLRMLVEGKESFVILTLEQMDRQYQFNTSQNAEVRFCWQTLCIRSEGELKNLV